MDKAHLDLLWILVSSALVFMMQAGFAMVESGLTRSKNSINVAIKNLTDFGVAALCFWVLGYGLMFGSGGRGPVGTTLFAPDGTGGGMGFFLFQLVFCGTSATIVSGAVAERMRFGSYIACTALFSLLLYPVAGHWAWGGALEGTRGGWLNAAGFVDFAGSTVVHSLGGWVSLAALLVIGPRTGRFPEGGKSREITGHDIPMAVLGVMLLWFGWFGFNGGSVLAMDGRVAPVLVNTTLGGAAGMCATLAVGWALKKKPDVGFVINGSLAGLVAITASCHAVTPAQSVVIGAVGGVAMLGATALLERLRIDDAVGAIPVHLAGGVWGTMAVGFFGDPLALGTGLDRMGQIGAQALGVAVYAAWGFGLSLGILALINRFSPLRVGPKAEADGLNLAEHGVTTEIHGLFGAMEAQAATGDISLRAPEEPFTEAGQIAALYNKVLDRLEEGTVEKRDFLRILETMGEGLFVIEPSLAIGPYRSAALGGIFGREELSGKKVTELLASFLSPSDAAAAEEFLTSCFDPAIAWRHLERMNPLASVEAHFDTGEGSFDEKALSFSFKRIEADGKIVGLLALARDLTRETRLRADAERAREEGRMEIEALRGMLGVDPSELSVFLESAREAVAAINRCFEASATGDGLRGAMEASHTMKGNAQMLGLDSVAEKAEALEIAMAAANSSSSGEALLRPAILLNDLSGTLSTMESLLGRISRMAAAAKGEGDPFLDSLREGLSRLAARYGKEASISYSGPPVSSIGGEGGRAVRGILPQLVRNSAYHGIEAPGEREAAGKPRAGRVEIEVEAEGGALTLRYRDDGKGIDAASVSRRAAALGLIGAGRELGAREAAALLFSPGFSTADRPDDVAGKGAGLAAVRGMAARLGGRTRLRSRPGASFEIEVRIPAGGAA